ncbi:MULTISPECIES: insecticidal delta-endotoxin Cry8Ea1 family protein [Bacillus]|uniref:insecticidal delta-endotoxin Cry8Ea1 family protein n=1 Tax=Bacillus TaxID=1386 RepID=UPI0002D23564|nr:MULTISPECIES: insecticidal delta-endotoxin Cry8Ea1 family protein [Bacillus]MEB9339537.1 insecticidal delta-endotoxin Cry8Ea1 family protein [Bacillus cereus]CCW06162.1 Cry [Bacillus sp. GeD10]
MRSTNNLDSILPEMHPIPSRVISHPDLFSLKNVNKHLRTTCEFNDPFGNILRNYVTASAGLIAVLAGVVTPIVPPLVVAGGVVNLFLPLLWPENSTAKDQKLMCEIGVLIDQKLNDFVYEQATRQLEGLEAVIEEYRDAVKSFQAKRLPRDVGAEWVRTQFQIVHSAIINAIPTFRLIGYEVTLLPLYCKLANTHLLLLRDIAAFGGVYGFTSKILESYYADLKERIIAYTDHCVRTYDVGLELAKKRKATINKNGNNPQYPWMFFPTIEKYDYQGIEDWNLFNAYRRTMTLLVLDWIAIWPTFDLKLYPIHMGLKTALTREVYTNIVGYHTLGNAFYWPWEDKPTLTKEQIEETFIRKPHLFTWLNQIDVRKSIVNDLITGLLLQYSHTLNPHIYTTSIGTTENTISSCNTIDYPVTKVNVLFNGREKINFIGFTSNTDTFSSCGYFINKPYYSPINCGKDCESRSAHVFNLSVPDTNTKGTSPEMVPFINKIQPHRLSWMYIGKSAAANDPAIDAVGCAWTHPSVDQQNMLASEGITQIPAVMSHTLEGNANVVKGPGSTGGNLVRLGPKSKMLLTITLPSIFKEYRLRIRCANQQNGSLILSVGLNQVNIALPINHHYHHTLNYRSFQIIDVPESVRLSIKEASQYTLQFGNLSEEIIIDKIEFLPLL